MANRYEVRTMSTDRSRVAVIDVEAQSVSREYNAADIADAFDHCDYLNEAEARYQSQAHTPEAFAAQWRATVN